MEGGKGAQGRLPRVNDACLSTQDLLRNDFISGLDSRKKIRNHLGWVGLDFQKNQPIHIH